MSKKIFLILLLFELTLGIALAEKTEVTVFFLKEQGKINQQIFGNNLIAYDPSTYEDWTKEYYSYSDFGAGIWDPKGDEPVKKVVDLAKTAGITVLRFPGGCGTHHYDWKNSIENKREHFLYGIDEFLKTCQAIGAEPVITLSYFEGDEHDKADLVEYLNSPDDKNNKWAALRVKNGHKYPYGVKYFEVGNEDWHGDHRSVKKVLPEDYAKRYLKYYLAMKIADPSVRIGAILWTQEWNKNVMGIIKDKVDFAIIHTYPSPEASRKKLVEMKSSDIFASTLAVPVAEDSYLLKDALVLLKKETGKDVPLAITEYNGGFVQDEPVPYRHCLGTALVNAELLNVFMKPENNVLMANYWQFNNNYWGMINNNFGVNAKGLYNPYYKRPNYYVFEMYHKYFGNILLDSEVKCESYEIKNQKIPYLSVNASKSEDDSKVYLIVINKNMDSSITSAIDLKDFVPAGKGDAWVLNGPGVDATNEKNHNNVKVTHKEFEIKGNPLEFTFEPHSLTAIEIERLGIGEVKKSSQ
jgi:alpha-L-arabinofuranosidase